MQVEAKLVNMNRRVLLIQELGKSTSKGNLRKWVAKIDGIDSVCYIKTNSNDVIKTGGYECESECVASLLGKLLGVECIRYIMEIMVIGNKKHKVCISRDFIEEGSYKTIARILRDIGKFSGEDKYRYIASNFYSYKYEIDKMLLFDSIINNGDRHLNNIGFLKSLDGNVRLAPIYDNGDSLFSTLTIEELRKVFKMRLSYTKSKPFMSVHSAQIKLIGNVKLNKISRTDVYRLINEYFSGERAKLLNKWLILRLGEEGLLYE